MAGIYDDEKTRAMSTPSAGSCIELRPHVGMPGGATSFAGSDNEDKH